MHVSMVIVLCSTTAIFRTGLHSNAHPPQISKYQGSEKGCNEFKIFPGRAINKVTCNSMMERLISSALVRSSRKKVF